MRPHQQGVARQYICDTSNWIFVSNYRSFFVLFCYNSTKPQPSLSCDRQSFISFRGIWARCQCCFWPRSGFREINSRGWIISAQTPSMRSIEHRLALHLHQVHVLEVRDMESSCSERLLLELTPTGLIRCIDRRRLPLRSQLIEVPSFKIFFSKWANDMVWRYFIYIKL